MKCPFCGNETDENVKFCKECGAKLSNESEVYQMPQQPQSTTNAENLPFYKKNLIVVLALLFIYPLGMFLMWAYKKDWKKPFKIFVSIVFAFGMIIEIVAFATTGSESGSTSPTVATQASESNVLTESSSEEATIEATTEAVTTVPAPTEDPNITIGMKNALKSAKSYLDFSAFSYDGLIKQLEYEKYSKEEATYAADNCGADWNEQAAKCAQNYIEYSSFSRDSLIDQLIYEGFTQEQAEYGVSQVGY